MSDLQLALVALGALLVAGVAIYNGVQERRARKRAEKAFGAQPPDALFDGSGERREPVLGELPAAGGRVDPTIGRLEQAFGEVAGPAGTAAAPEAQAPPLAEISSRIDTVAVILADEPVSREQVAPLLDALQAEADSVRVEGIVNEQWYPIELAPRQSWRELRVGLQLASRSGPVSEEDVDAFNRLVGDFAASVNAVSQREPAAAAAARARELDGFCAQADIEVAVNVVGLSGVTFAMPRVKSLALEHGFSETASGELLRFGSDGAAECAIRRFGDDPSRPPPAYATGLTFALDVPRVADTISALARMVAVAQSFAAALGGQLVDDNRRPLTDAGLASIRRSLGEIVGAMEAHGIPAGSPLARRLFA